MTQRSRVSLSPGDIELITVAHPPLARDGKDIAITFHATRALLARSEQLHDSEMPPGIGVVINGRQADAHDLTGAGTYAVIARTAGGSSTTAPLIFAPESGSRALGEPDAAELKVTGSIKTVPCPPGCVSAIFHTPCVICIEISIEVEF